MEAIVCPMEWAQWPAAATPVFKGFRSPAGEDMALTKNVFVERVLPGSILRKLTEEEMAVYRRPFAEPGESRRPTLTWPRQIPLGGEPANVVAVVRSYADWLAKSPVPKLFVNAEPGAILIGAQREFCRALSESAGSHREGQSLPAGGLAGRDRGRNFELAREDRALALSTPAIRIALTRSKVCC